MADENNGAAEAADETKVGMRVLAQYIRDISFENIVAQKGIGGELDTGLSVSVNLDARKHGQPNHFEVMMKLNLNSKDKTTNQSLFLLELEYAGVFEVTGVQEDQLHPFLLIECPRFLFPYARRIVSDMTRDGGFPPVNLENIDFLQLYRQELARRQASQQEASDGEATIN